jgi:hypothetical protein
LLFVFFIVVIVAVAVAVAVAVVRDSTFFFLVGDDLIFGSLPFLFLLTPVVMGSW